ncbi:carboxymuconolactone decarboxylase family protein [Aliiroseovarius sp. PrR006]|uniref:carboxymuconolactone decarboxylase family protein n=1 Tax=Aliiroseovarius sp. PrR006 TaxID=2706883 RepID=UPI0013CF6F4D|nr:carboxymuconolactone decarboxylase family protein [Aliiroseovarius sp. PrR006]NDW54146.1 carboxymuconolactone decarboxylase family protein [Aliiroseovarius sp. PrR006]
MPRLPEISDSDFDTQTRAAFDRMAAYGAFENWSRVAAHHPPVLDQVGAMLTALRDGTTLPTRLSELAMVTVSKINVCDYCTANHGPKLQVTGLSAEGVERLPDAENHPELTELERLVVHYAEAVTTRHGKMRDGEVDALRAHLSDAQIVELTWRIALTGAFNRFNDALQVAPE